METTKNQDSQIYYIDPDGTAVLKNTAVEILRSKDGYKLMVAEGYNHEGKILYIDTNGDPVLVPLNFDSQAEFDGFAEDLGIIPAELAGIIEKYYGEMPEIAE